MALAPQHLLVIELDGVDALVLLAGGDALLVDEVQQVGVNLVGSDALKVAPGEISLKIAEVGGIYAHGMAAVAHLLQLL